MVLSGICIICIYRFTSFHWPATAETPSAETSEASATSAERTEIAAATAETSEKYGRDSSTSMATCGIPFFSSEKQRQEK